MKILEGTYVDAVLLEYNKEGMDAEAIAYQIKQRFPKRPIILVSAFSDMPGRIIRPDTRRQPRLPSCLIQPRLAAAGWIEGPASTK